MRWTTAIMGIGIITAGCGDGTSGSTSGGGGSTSATTATTGGQGGSGGSGGATSATASTGDTSSSTASASSSSASSSASTGTGMGAVFGATCTANTDCASGLCANFMQKGMHCSVQCLTDADCPPESPGCGGQGVCKPPL